MWPTYDIALGDKTSPSLVTVIPHVSRVEFRFLREETIEPTTNIPYYKIRHYQLFASKVSMPISFGKWIVHYKSKAYNSEQETDSYEEYIANPTTTTSGGDEIIEEEIRYWNDKTRYRRIVGVTATFVLFGDNKILRNSNGVILRGANGTLLRNA